MSNLQQEIAIAELVKEFPWLFPTNFREPTEAEMVELLQEVESSR
jgi:hypothetical protein